MSLQLKIKKPKCNHCAATPTWLQSREESSFLSSVLSPEMYRLGCAHAGADRLVSLLGLLAVPVATFNSDAVIAQGTAVPGK